MILHSYGLISRRLFLGLIIGLTMAGVAQAATYTNIATGNWSDPFTWDAARLVYPNAAGDVVNITSTAPYTVTADATTANLGAVTVGGGSSLLISDAGVVYNQTTGSLKVGNSGTLSLFDASAGTINFASSGNGNGIRVGAGNGQIRQNDLAWHGYPERHR